VGHVVCPSPDVEEGDEDAVVGDEGPSAAELVVAGSLRLSYEDLHCGKETSEDPQSSTRRRGQEGGRRLPELLTGAARTAEQGR
jgi:hypothetical protein